MSSNESFDLGPKPDLTYDILTLSTTNVTVGEGVRINADFSNFEVVGKPTFRIDTYQVDNSATMQEYFPGFFNRNTTTNLHYYDITIG